MTPADADDNAVNDSGVDGVDYTEYRNGRFEIAFIRDPLGWARVTNLPPDGTTTEIVDLLNDAVSHGHVWPPCDMKKRHDFIAQYETFLSDLNVWVPKVFGSLGIQVFLQFRMLRDYVMPIDSPVAECRPDGWTAGMGRAMIGQMLSKEGVQDPESFEKLLGKYDIPWQLIEDVEPDAQWAKNVRAKWKNKVSDRDQTPQDMIERDVSDDSGNEVVLAAGTEINGEEESDEKHFDESFGEFQGVTRDDVHEESDDEDFWEFQEVSREDVREGSDKEMQDADNMEAQEQSDDETHMARVRGKFDEV